MIGTAVLVGLLILAHSCICVHTRVHTAAVPSAWGGGYEVDSTCPPEPPEQNRDVLFQRRRNPRASCLYCASASLIHTTAVHIYAYKRFACVLSAPASLPTCKTFMSEVEVCCCCCCCLCATPLWCCFGFVQPASFRAV